MPAASSDDDYNGDDDVTHAKSVPLSRIHTLHDVIVHCVNGPLRSISTIHLA